MKNLPPYKSRASPRPLADLIGAALHPVLAKQGFGESAIILNWEEIVGLPIGQACEPIKLQWPPRNGTFGPDALPEPAVLVLRVEGYFAIELQHLVPLVIERVNAHFGWRCIAKLSLRQAPLLRNTRQKPRLPRPINPEALAMAQISAAAIDEGPLREALIRLGTCVLGQSSSN